MLQRTILLSAVSMLLAFQVLAAEPPKPESHIRTFTTFIPQLNQSKQVWIYLPPDYGNDKHKRFPVLYMQDGQDLFESMLHSLNNPYINESMSRDILQRFRRYGSWQIDKRLDRLFSEKKTDGIIIVGVSSRTSNRTAEYSPWPWRDVPRPEGERYAEFIVQTLKPYIDENYLTLSERNDTGIAGSSMGGLLALYAGLKYQNVFSKVAAFSPVLTPDIFGPLLLEHIGRQGKSYGMKIYVDLGSAELSFGPIKPVYEALRAAGFLDAELRFRLIPRGEHRVAHWGERFPEALMWLYRQSKTYPYRRHR